MSANPMVPPAPTSIAYLAPPTPVEDPLQSELAAVTRELQTERSAGKALLAAVCELESRLAGERQTVAAVTADNAELQLKVEAGRELEERRRKENSALSAQLLEVSDALTREINKPAWRRLFGC